MSVSVGSLFGRKTIRMHVSTGGPVWAQFAIPLFYSGGLSHIMGFNATFEEPSAASSAILCYGFVSGPDRWPDVTNTDLFCGCRVTLSYNAAEKRYFCSAANANYIYKIGATWTAVASSTVNHNAATTGRTTNPFWGATFAIKRRSGGSNWAGFFPAGDWTTIRGELRDYKMGERVLTAINNTRPGDFRVPWSIFAASYHLDNLIVATNPETVAGKILDRVYVGMQATTGSTTLHIFNIGFQEGRYETMNPYT